MPSSGELFVILLVVFILFGGKGLQDFARTLGKWTRKIQNASREFQRELNIDEIRRELNDDSPYQHPLKPPQTPPTPPGENPDKSGDPDKSDLQG